MPGRLIVPTLDPTYHHHNNFMPGSTRSLYPLLTGWTTPAADCRP